MLLYIINRDMISTVLSLLLALRWKTFQENQIPAFLDGGSFCLQLEAPSNSNNGQSQAGVMGRGHLVPSHANQPISQSFILQRALHCHGVSIRKGSRIDQSDGILG